MQMWYSLLDKIPEERVLAYYHRMIKRARGKKTEWSEFYYSQHQIVNMVIIEAGMKIVWIYSLKIKCFRELYGITTD